MTSTLKSSHGFYGSSGILLLIFAFAAPAAALAQDTEDAGERKGEMRFSLSATEEYSGFISRLAIQPAQSNLLLVQPSFSYRHDQQWRFVASLAGLAYTYGETYSRLRVKETYVSGSLGDWDFTAGKKILRWGTGYAFTPTGVLDPPRNPANPADRLNLNEGREMTEVNWVRGKHAVTAAWAAAGLAERHRFYMRETAAFRYNTQVSGFDTSLIYARYRGGANFAGANFTRVLGSSVEIHGEYARRSGSEYVNVPGESGPVLLTENRRNALLLGGKYTHRTGISGLFEFFTSSGLVAVNGLFSPPLGGPPLTERRSYAFARIGKSRLRELPGWKEWDAGGMILANLSDGSQMLILDAERRLGNRLTAYAHATIPRGKKWRSEYGMIPYRAQFTIGLRFHLL